MSTQDHINDTRPHEPIPPGNTGTADRQVLDNGGADKEDSQPEVTCSSSRGVIAQSLVAGAVLLLTACCGMNVGYSAILLPQLRADNSTLPTDEELGSWIASVQAVASPFGCFIGGLLLDRWGRRRTLILCSVSFAASWIILASATNHAIILTARAMAGFSAGVTIWPPQVVADEISQSHITGVLTATKFLSHSLGILLVYILGAVMKWNVVSGVSAALPLLSLVAFVLLPESPVWLIKKKTQEAERALWWLRGEGVGIQEKQELDQLFSRYGSRKDEGVVTNAGTTRTQSCCQYVSKPDIIKPLIIVSIFHLIQIISGTYLVIFYAVDIITQAEIGDVWGLDRFLAAVVTAAVRLIFAVLTCFLLRWIGRRPLLLIAGSLQAISALSVGIFLYLKNVIVITDYEFPACKSIIIASILAYVATNTCSYFPMPGTAMEELLPAKTRRYIGGYILAGTYLGVFVTTKFFPWLCHLLELHGVFGLFGITTAIGTFIMYLLLPESSGKSVLQIENYFCQPNIMWVGRNVVLRRKERKHKTEYYQMQVRVEETERGLLSQA